MAVAYLWPQEEIANYMPQGWLDQLVVQREEEIREGILQGYPGTGDVKMLYI